MSMKVGASARLLGSEFLNLIMFLKLPGNPTDSQWGESRLGPALAAKGASHGKRGYAVHWIGGGQPILAIRALILSAVSFGGWLDRAVSNSRLALALSPLCRQATARW